MKQYDSATYQRGYARGYMSGIGMTKQADEIPAPAAVPAAQADPAAVPAGGNLMNRLYDKYQNIPEADKPKWSALIGAAALGLPVLGIGAATGNRKTMLWALLAALAGGAAGYFGGKNIAGYLKPSGYDAWKTQTKLEPAIKLGQTAGGAAGDMGSNARGAAATNYTGFSPLMGLGPRLRQLEMNRKPAGAARQMPGTPYEQAAMDAANQARKPAGAARQMPGTPYEQAAPAKIDTGKPAPDEAGYWARLVTGKAKPGQ